MLRLGRSLYTSAALLALVLATGNSTHASSPPQSSSATASIKYGNVNYIDARVFFNRFGLKSSWISRDRSMLLQSNWTKIEIEEDKREAQFNGLRVLLGDAVIARNGTLYISRIDAEKLFQPILSPSSITTPPAPAVRVIVIDAGHGGQDTGTQNKTLNLNEKTYTLDVAKRLRDLLVKQGYKVVMTRTDDRFIELPQRAEISNKAGADLFISIHFNAVAGAPTVKGAETYVMTPRYQRSTSSSKPDPSDNVANLGNLNDPWNSVLGYYIHNEVLGKVGSLDRGLKRARFAVLRLVKAPAVLIEAGYLSNIEEARRIATPGYRASLANAIAEGIRDYTRAISTANPR